MTNSVELDSGKHGSPTREIAGTITVAGLGLRALPCPFPEALNPHVEAVNEESYTWLERSRMLERRGSLDQLRLAKTGWLVARTNPLVPRDMLRLLADWYNWLFAYDDGFCEASPTGGRAGPLALALPRLLRVLDEPDVPASDDEPFACALSDVRRRIARIGSPEQLERWCASVKEYLFAQVWEAGNREAHVVPSLPDYLLMRRATGATFTCLAIIDVAGGYHLDTHAWHHPTVRELSRLAVDIVGFDNDLFSYAKEHRHDSAHHNLVTVVAADRSCSAEDAFHAVVEMHCDALSAFEATKAGLSGWASEPVLRYVTALEHWIRGHIDYSLGSARYRIEAPPRVEEKAG